VVADHQDCWHQGGMIPSRNSLGRGHQFVGVRCRLRVNRDRSAIVTSPVSVGSGGGKRTNVDLASDEQVSPFRLG
jgi:hypothetical protein